MRLTPLAEQLEQSTVVQPTQTQLFTVQGLLELAGEGRNTALKLQLLRTPVGVVLCVYLVL